MPNKRYFLRKNPNNTVTLVMFGEDMIPYKYDFKTGEWVQKDIYAGIMYGGSIGDEFDAIDEEKAMKLVGK